MTVPFGAIIRGAVALGRVAGDDDGPDTLDAAGKALGQTLEHIAATGPVSLGAVVKFDRVNELLSQVAAGAADLRPVYRGRIDPHVSQLFESQFETAGKALGTPWPALSVTTKKLRTRVMGKRVRRTTNKAGRARYGFSAILRDTGRLARSFTVSGAPEGVREIGRMAYVRGSDVPYAALHQDGFDIVKMFGRPLKSAKRVPARPVVPSNMPAPVLNAWEGYLVQYLESGTV